MVKKKDSEHQVHHHLPQSVNIALIVVAAIVVVIGAKFLTGGSTLGQGDAYLQGGQRPIEGEPIDPYDGAPTQDNGPTDDVKDFADLDPCEAYFTYMESTEIISEPPRPPNCEDDIRVPEEKDDETFYYTCEEITEPKIGIQVYKISGDDKVKFSVPKFNHCEDGPHSLKSRRIVYSCASDSEYFDRTFTKSTSYCLNEGFYYCKEKSGQPICWDRIEESLWEEWKVGSGGGVKN